MHKLYSLKDKFIKELNEYADRSSFSASDIETVRNLISSVNKLCEFTDAEEGKETEHSNRMSRRAYPVSYDDYGNSYRRRDSMGRYSRHSITDKLYEVMEEAPEHQKHEIKMLIDKMGQM